MKYKFALIVVIVLGITAWLTASLIGGTPQSTGNVAVISLSGVIAAGQSNGLLDQATIASGDIVSLIDQADKNPNIKAIIIKINSGGGTPVGSAQIAQAVLRTDKLTISVIEDIGASGAYWVASASDYILANELSIVGSIGVFASYLEFSGLFEKYGISYERLVAGKYKDTRVPFKPLSTEEKLIVQTQLDLAHEFFINEVAKNRKLTTAQVTEISTAAVYLGIQAKEINLIDDFGGTLKAISIIEKKFNETAVVIKYGRKKSFLDIFSELSSKQSFTVGQGIGSAFLATSHSKLTM